jgi:hypothetical protein
MPPDAVVVVFFLLSVGAAWVLFKFLRSTGVIKTKQYQLGGAAAGCLILYSAMYGSYNHLAGLQLEATKLKLNDCEKQLAIEETELPIGGTVSPVLKNATVMLAVKTTNLGDDGRFGLTGKGLDLTRDAVSVYVVGETDHGLLQQHYQLLAGDDTQHLKVTLQLER